jgi:hypothetical protein
MTHKNGKMIQFPEAWWCGEGMGGSCSGPIDGMKVYVTTFPILHKLFNCEITGLERWTCSEITDPSYSELTSHVMSGRAMTQAVSLRFRRGG